MKATIKLLLAPVLMLSAAGCFMDEAPARDESRAPIVGGEATTAAPATGALVRFGATWCTATVVEPRKLVTAAHCLDGIEASSLSFVLGPRVDAPEAVIPVAEIQGHPGFSFQTLADDIGYVILAEDAPVAPVPVAPIDGNWEGRELLFVGYGASNGFSQTGAGIKRAVRMSIEQVGATQFSYADAGKNTCNGDSGGPAFWVDALGNMQIVGVTSYGDANCVQFGVDTRVDTYLDFLGLSGTNPDPDPEPDPDPDPDPSSCGGETFEGRCEGTTVIWCEDDQVKSGDCATQGQACGFSEEAGYYGCVADPCNGETFEGRCDGSTVVWCENDQVNTLECPGSCGLDGTQGYYNCL